MRLCSCSRPREHRFLWRRGPHIVVRLGALPRRRSGRRCQRESSRATITTLVENFPVEVEVKRGDAFRRERARLSCRQSRLSHLLQFSAVPHAVRDRICNALDSRFLCDSPVYSVLHRFWKRTHRSDNNGPAVGKRQRNDTALTRITVGRHDCACHSEKKRELGVFREPVAPDKELRALHQRPTAFEVRAVGSHNCRQIRDLGRCKFH